MARLQVHPKSRDVVPVTALVAGEVAGEVTPEVARLIRLCTYAKSRQELPRKLSLNDDEHFRKAYLLPALELSSSCKHPVSKSAASPQLSRGSPR